MDTRFNRLPTENFRWEIQGNISRFPPRGFVFCSLLKAVRFLDAHKEFILSLLFFVLEAISVVLDLIGKNKPAILLVALLLAAFGFAVSLCSIIKATNDQISNDQKQIKVAEFAFSVIQLIAAFLVYLFTVLGVETHCYAWVFPLAFAAIAVVFSFIKGRRITDPSPIPISLLGSTPIDSGPSTTDSTDENLQQPTGSMTSITIETDPIRTSTSQVNPPGSSTTVRQRPHAGKQIKTIIFSKHLVRTDIEARLIIPTSALEHIEIPEDDNKLDLMVRDSAGLTWKFRLIRPDGHPKLALTSGWVEFVRAKGLRIGDEVILGTTQEDEAGGGAQYMILVNRDII